MRTAVCLIGNYNPIYKKNNYSGDIFTCTYEDLSQIDDPFTQKYVIDRIYNINCELNIIQLVRFETICDIALEKIYKYEETNSVKYDIYIVVFFNSILFHMPTHPGIYTCKDIETIQIVSSTYVRLGFHDRPIYLYDLDRPTLRKIFQKLFGNKVYLSDEITHESPLSASVIFLVQSVIHTSQTQVTEAGYDGHRTIFSGEERLEQTVKQVRNLSKIVSDKSVLLLEGSKLSITDLDRLYKYCNVILYCQDKEASHCANVHKNKSTYEIYVFKDIIRHLKFDWVIKFGGRYDLATKIFDLRQILRDKPVFHMVGKELTFTKSDPIFSVVMYSIPDKYKMVYCKILEKMYSDIMLHNNSDAIENLMCFYVGIYMPDFINIDMFNIHGLDGVYGFYQIM